MRQYSIFCKNFLVRRYLYKIYWINFVLVFFTLISFTVMVSYTYTILDLLDFYV